MMMSSYRLSSGSELHILDDSSPKNSGSLHFLQVFFGRNFERFGKRTCSKKSSLSIENPSTLFFPLQKLTDPSVEGLALPSPLFSRQFRPLKRGGREANRAWSRPSIPCLLVHWLPKGRGRLQKMHNNGSDFIREGLGCLAHLQKGGGRKVRGGEAEETTFRETFIARKGEKEIFILWRLSFVGNKRTVILLRF